MEQFIETSAGTVVFRDAREMHYSSPCQPRDIIVVSGPSNDRVRAEIAVDVRRGQGYPEIGIAKNLKFS